MCVCKVSKVTESCVVMESNVGCKRATELLEDMSGNTYTVVDACIKRVTIGQIIFHKDCDGFREFADA